MVRYFLWNSNSLFFIESILFLLFYFSSILLQLFLHNPQNLVPSPLNFHNCSIPFISCFHVIMCNLFRSVKFVQHLSMPWGNIFNINLLSSIHFRLSLWTNEECYWGLIDVFKRAPLSCRYLSIENYYKPIQGINKLLTITTIEF